MIVRFAVLAACLAGVLTAACTNPFVPHYEYEEQVYLSVDGHATVVVDASLPALVALRGLKIDPSGAGTDRTTIREVLEAARCRVDSVSRLWERLDRKFVQIQVSADAVQRLSDCALLAWSKYSLAPIEEQGLGYLQSIGPATPADPGKVAWQGTELVAFKLHLPSRIRYQNVKRLDGSNGTSERGNILTWEQRFSDRRAGVPVAIVVNMDGTSILNTTLLIFAGAFIAAVLVLLSIIWWVVRKGRARPAPR
jgi:hypothetical protein